MNALQQSSRDTRRFPSPRIAIEPSSLWDGASADARGAVLAAGQSASRFRAVTAGQLLYAHGAPTRHLYVLMRGAMHVSLTERCANEDLRERIVDLAVAGDVLGFADFAAGTHRADAMAIGDCGVYMIKPRAWDRIAARSVDVPSLAELAAYELRRALRHAMRLRLNAMSRLADFLLEWNQKSGVDTPGTGPVRLPSGKTLANYLDLRHETLSRTFHKMESLACFRRVEHRVLYAVDWPLLRKIRATTWRRQV